LLYPQKKEKRRLDVKDSKNLIHIERPLSNLSTISKLIKKNSTTLLTTQRLYNKIGINTLKNPL
jgi:hypothetical protein